MNTKQLVSILSKHWMLIRRVLVVILVVLAVWLVFRPDHKAAVAPKSPSPAKVSAGSLQVLPSDANSSPLNLQQTTSPIDNPSSAVQPGQSDLQPAGNSAQLPSGL